MRLLPCLLAILAAAPAWALEPGALIALGMQSDSPDSFSMLALQDIPAGTKLFFTDNGVNADGSFRATEGTVSWTLGSALLAGTEAHLDFDNETISVGSAEIATQMMNEGGGFPNLSHSGDTIAVYTMAGDTVEFVTAITMNDWLTEGNATDSNDSRIPPVLRGTPFAINSTLEDDGDAPQVDNVMYDCQGGGMETGTAAELASRISAIGAFVTSNSAFNPLPPPGCSWTVVSECDDVCTADDACPADCVIFDAFDAGLDGWSMGSNAPSAVTNPAGGLGGDGILTTVSTGQNGSAGKMNVFNEDQWTGDWAGIGRDVVTFHARTDTPLTLRLVIESNSTANRANSTVGVDVPADGEWHVVSFDTTAADFTLADQGADIDAILGDVTRLRIAHLPAADAARPPTVAAQLDLDSISTEPLPNVCGDSAIGGVEVCDGGSLGDADCTDLGYTEPTGAVCSETCDAVVYDSCEAVCGDFNPEPGEDCDSGGVNSASCDFDCTEVSPVDGVCNVEAGETPITATFDCASVCGDGLASGDEECDGSDLNGGACTDLGYSGGTLGCTDECGFDAQSCTTVCGNGVIEPGEACDDGSATATCTAECTVPGCGDGVCSPLAGETPETCPDDCEAVCGDGLVSHSEACDGFVPTNIDCTTQGYTSPDGAQCTEQCDGVVYTGCLATCGDFNVEPGEGCDDGGIGEGDGCSPVCQPEEGYDCDPITGCEAVCGDGFVRGEEACDDEGTEDGDGCAADCTVEAGYVCDDGEPTLCLVDTDGDGVADDEDNCPDEPNADQADTDGNGVGDACDDADTEVDTDDPDTDEPDTDVDTDQPDPDTELPVDTDDSGLGNQTSTRCSCQTQSPGVAFAALPLLLVLFRRRRLGLTG